MKVLGIGNSFSEDATCYLQKIANSAGIEMNVVNLYLGACSFEMHADNIKNNSAVYRYELNGVHTPRNASVVELLQEDKWDVITVQQVSGLSGVYETYEPYATFLLDTIKQYAPQANIYCHRTWAYDPFSKHPDFARYGNSSSEMFKCIKEATDKFAKAHDIEILPCGDVIDALRNTAEFDVTNGGLSLCRDGHHLDLIYARYAVAAVWFQKMTNINIDKATFVPQEKDLVNGYTIENYYCDKTLIELIKEHVNKVV